MLKEEIYLDDNIRVSSLPIVIKTNKEYRGTLEKRLSEYIKCLNQSAFAADKKMLKFVTEECKLILKIIDSLISSNDKYADKLIENMFLLFERNSFLISDLDKSYSFRGIAPFKDLQDNGYDDGYAKMMNTELTFYRVRTKKKNDKEKITDIEHMLHLPYNLRKKASSMRFSNEDLPGLYLGTTTYMCSKECKWNGTDELYASVFVPNSIGKKLKILNLTIFPALINGICTRNIDSDNVKRYELQKDMLKIFPIVIATSFSVEQDEEVKYQYLFSQALMRQANKNGIDGIAYLSMKGENEFQYPQGVNLAIPAVDISENNNYSKKCEGFNISKPVLYSGQEGKKKASYVNQIYKKYDSNGIESDFAKLDMDKEIKFYEDTAWSKFDDFLAEKIIE